MSSLNEWAYTPEEMEQLAEEENLDNQIVIEDEISGEIQFLKANEIHYQDLVNLKNNLNQQGGINRALATEAMDLEVNVGNPNFYSTAISTEGYKVAMENINIAIGAAIAAALTTVVFAISKVLTYLLGGSPNSAGEGSAAAEKASKSGKLVIPDGKEVTTEQATKLAEEQAENLAESIQGSAEALQKTTEELKDVFRGGLALKEFDNNGDVIHGGTYHVRNLRDLITYLGLANGDDYATTLTRAAALSFANGYVNDLITNGPMITYLTGNHTAINTLINSFLENQRQQPIRKAIEQALDVAQGKVMTGTRNQAEHNFKILKTITDRYNKLVKEDLVTIISDVREINAHVQEVTKLSFTEVNYFEFVEQYARACMRNKHLFKGPMVSIDANLVRAIGDYAEESALIAEDPQWRTDVTNHERDKMVIQSAIRILADAAAKMAQLVGMLRKYRDAQLHAMQTINAYFKDIYKVLRKYAKDGRAMDIELEDFKEASTRIDNILNDYYGSPREFFTFKL